MPCPLEQQVERVFRILPSDSECVTADTPYALPQDFMNGNVCHLHSGGTYPEGEDLWWAGAPIITETEESQDETLSSSEAP